MHPNDAGPAESVGLNCYWENDVKRLKLTTPADTRRAINRVANMVLNGELEAKDANAILYACNAVLSAIRIDEQQRRLDELERLVKEYMR